MPGDAATDALTADRPATRLATRIAFFAAGFGVACWSPLVPYAKERLTIDNAQLGLLLLCLGLGSVIAMPVTGGVCSRWGSRPMILAGGIGMAVVLPLLALVASPLTLGLALLAFGGSLGTLDVAMNVHGSEVERAAGVPLMSGFHGMFSVGAFAGAGGATLLLTHGWQPLAVATAGAVLVAVMIATIAPRLLKGQPTGGGGAMFAVPHGFVVMLAALAAILFLIEGAVLDWGALLLVETKGFAPAEGGLGYMLLAIAMTIGRLTGDRTVTALGNRRMLVWGGAAAVAGFVVVALWPGWLISLAGFLLIGAGAANLVPIVFSAAGRQTAMPAGLAIAAVTTAGYAGNLLGPAIIGLVAHATSLTTAFVLLGVLTIPVPFAAGLINDAGRSPQP